MEFEDSREKPSTKDYEIAMSNINSAREQELSKAREYVKSQIIPFAKKCVLLEPYWDMHPTFQEFCRHVLSSDPANTNRTFIRDVLYDYGIKEFYAKSQAETTQLMQEILRIYQQEKITFETEIKKECKDVLQLIANGNFVIQKNTSNCIMVDYVINKIFYCNPETYKSIANNYLQQYCPEKYQKLTLKEINLSGCVLELTK